MEPIAAFFTSAFLALTPHGQGIVPHPSGCPAVQFCGCGVSVKVFGHPVRDLYPASAWRRFPRAAAGPGMVAIWANRHVAYIISADGGDALLYDPNGGQHQTWIHRRSLAGATIVNPGG